MNDISPDHIALFDKLLEPSRRSDVPGYVVGIAINERTVYRRATGLASIEFAVANTPVTRMRIASITKQFTGLAVMLLVEDGKLDINKPLRNYLPDLAGPNGAPTLRQLLNHTSGVRDALESAAFFLTEGLFPQIPAGLTHKWSSQFSTGNFEPGEAWSYSNYGYMLLSLVIEKVSGLSLEEFFKQRIFAPLGMTDTELFRNDMELLPGLATSHIKLPDGRYRRGIYPCEELVGGGGIVSTVDDMLRWAENLREPHRVGTPASWAAILGAHRFTDGVASTYGFGIKNQLHRGIPLVWHDGSTYGSKSALLTYPTQGLDIVVMANRSDSEPSAMAVKIAETLLADTLGPAKVNADAAGREALVGNYYSSRSRRVFTVREHAGKLMFAINANPEGLLQEIDGVLSCDSTAGPLSLRYADTTVAEIEVTLCGKPETYARLPAAPPASGDVAASIIGNYQLADFGTPVKIIVEGDTLYIDLCSRFHPNRIHLAPQSADVFLFTMNMLGSSAQGIVTLERQDGAVSGFFLSIQRTWNLYFARSAA